VNYLDMKALPLFSLVIRTRASSGSGTLEVDDIGTIIPSPNQSTAPFVHWHRANIKTYPCSAYVEPYYPEGEPHD